MENPSCDTWEICQIVKYKYVNQTLTFNYFYMSTHGQLSFLLTAEKQGYNIVHLKHNQLEFEKKHNYSGIWRNSFLIS